MFDKMSPEMILAVKNNIKKNIDTINSCYNDIVSNLETLYNTKDINEKIVSELNNMFVVLREEQSKFNNYSDDMISYLEELRIMYIPFPDDNDYRNNFL